MAESSPYRQKTLWEKEKLLITSNFSFSHSVFKRLKVQTRKNQGLFGKGLKWCIREWVNTYKVSKITLYQSTKVLKTCKTKGLFGKGLTKNNPNTKKESFENILGKGDKCWKPLFFFFPLFYSSYNKQTSNCELHLLCQLQMFSIWTSLKFGCLVKLTHYQTTNLRLFQTERVCRRQFPI